MFNSGILACTCVQLKSPFILSAKKVVVFKKGQHPYIGGYAHDQEPLSPVPLRLFYQYARHVINDDGGKKDEDVNGHKSHVKQAAC